MMATNPGVRKGNKPLRPLRMTRTIHGQPCWGLGESSALLADGSMFNVSSWIFRARNQQPKARLLPLVLSVVVVSFGCFIHGSSVVFGGIAVVGLDAASKTMKANCSSTELGFDWDNTHDSAWLGKTALQTTCQF